MGESSDSLEVLPFQPDSSEDGPLHTSHLLVVKIPPQTPPMGVTCHSSSTMLPWLTSQTIGVENEATPSWIQSELAYNTFQTETTLTERMSEIDGPNNVQILNREISIKTEKRAHWPRGSDYLGSTLAFSLSLHSLWSLPISVLQHGGVTFLLLYTVILATLGAPLLLLEMSLGQYSGLAPGQLFPQLCPVLGGLGLAVCVLAVVRAMLDMAVVMWAGQALWRLFS